MIQVSPDVFEKMVADAIDSLPERFTKYLNNVAIVWDDEPSSEQRKKLHLRGDQTLFGLYEGIPLTGRMNNYNLVLPDKITVFKRPLEWASHDIDSLFINIKHTLWHEIAHHHGLDHDRINELEKN